MAAAIRDEYLLSKVFGFKHWLIVDCWGVTRLHI